MICIYSSRAWTKECLRVPQLSPMAFNGGMRNGSCCKRACWVSGIQRLEGRENTVEPIVVADCLEQRAGVFQQRVAARQSRYDVVFASRRNPAVARKRGRQAPTLQPPKRIDIVADIAGAENPAQGPASHDRVSADEDVVVAIS